jgi:iron(III) transport system substrate-binding protein
VTSRFLGLLVLAAFACACRVERVSPRGEGDVAASSATPAGELWVYTSMYPALVDALDPLVRERFPKLTVHWFKGGSEKVANRLEAELAAGGTQADVLAVSDPFAYERLRRDGHWLRYASPDGLRRPASLIDLDGHYGAIRISTMVLAHRRGLADPPTSWRALADPKWRGAVAVGDPLASGTAFTWAVFLEHLHGTEFFTRLRENGAVVAGGNAAVQQKIESGEVQVGVLLLENVLFAQAKGSDLAFTLPEDGAVGIPGYAAVFRSSRNPVAAKAFVDLLLSAEGQRLMLDPGRMHAVDPRLPGPSGLAGLDDLLSRSLPWSPALLDSGVVRGQSVKSAFTRAFAQ